MSIGPERPGPTLHGEEGELVSVRISVEPRLLERLLDILAQLDFPINPQLYHGTPASVVEFPAWAGRLPAVREALRRSGFGESCLRAANMLEAISRQPSAFSLQPRSLCG
jgi:hypothetical protein